MPTAHGLQFAKDPVDVGELERRFRRRGVRTGLGDACPADAQLALTRPAGEEADRDRHLVRREALEKIGEKGDLLQSAARVGNRLRSENEVAELHWIRQYRCEMRRSALVGASTGMSHVETIRAWRPAPMQARSKSSNLTEG